MNKKLITTALLITALLLGYNGCFADTHSIQNKNTEEIMPIQEDFPPHKGLFNKNKEFHNMAMPAFHPTRAEMEAKKAEIDKRLNLSEKQKKQLEINRNKDCDKIKPILEKLKQNRIETRKLRNDTSISDKDKEEQLLKLRKEFKELKKEADKCRKQNMKNFESVLNKTQKAEFEKIKQEQKEDMQKRKKAFEEHMKEIQFDKGNRNMNHPPYHPLPVKPVQEQK